jgi:hypothetical protein
MSSVFILLLIITCFLGTNGLKFKLSEKGIPHLNKQSSSLYPLDALAQVSSSRDLNILNEILPSPRVIPNQLNTAPMDCIVQSPVDIVHTLLERTETPISILPRLCSFFSERRSLVFVLEYATESLYVGWIRYLITRMISIALTLFQVPRITIVLPFQNVNISMDTGRGWVDKVFMIEFLTRWFLNPLSDSDELKISDILPDLMMAENTSVFYFGTSSSTPLDTVRLVDRLRNGVFPAYLTFISLASRSHSTWMSLVMYVLPMLTF